MSDLFYNRDRNITGVADITGLTVSPIYGSSVSFSTRANEIKYPNRFLRRAGSCLNSVIAEYNLSFMMRDDDVASIINYLESRSGTLPVSMVDASQIYQPISGFADDFSWRATSNSNNEVSTRLTIDNRSPQLNWSGLSFVNADFRQWTTNETVPQYAIRYFESDGQNKFNNFFYCTGEHVSSVANAPFSTGSFWTQSIFLDQSFEYSVATKPDVSKIEFNNSFYQRIRDKKNIHSFENFVLRFEGLSDEKTKALLHFVESKFGQMKFVYRPAKIYNRDKLFYCPSWRHTWVFKNSNMVELDLFEEPMGILPQNNSPSILLSQLGGQSYINYNTQSVNGISLVSYGGGDKTIIADGETTKIWSDNPQSVGIFGATTGFSAVGQRLESVVLSDKSSVVNLSLPDNNLSNLLLNSSRRLQHLNVSGNSLFELDISNITGLKSLNIANNRISELDISSNPNLTGIYCSGNQISSLQISGCLDALTNFGRYSGTFDSADGEFVDFSTNGPLSGTSFNDANTLGWRGWNLNFDNAKIPLDVNGYGSPMCHFKQETITGYSDGQSIFTWDDPIRNGDASRIVVSDSLRPRYDEHQLNARPALYFNGESWLAQTLIVNAPNSYSIFAVVKPGSSGFMSVFSDYFNRGLFISGNRLMSKTNQGNNLFAALSGDSYNVVGLSTNGTIVTGAVNTQTPSTGSKAGPSNINLPGSIGMNRNGTGGIFDLSSSSAAPFVGHISEIVIMTGAVNFPLMMRDLGAKHGIEIT